MRGRRKPPPGTPLSCPGPPLWEVWPLGPGWGQAGSGGERSLVVCQGCVSCAQMWDLLCLSLEGLLSPGLGPSHTWLTEGLKSVYSGPRDPWGLTVSGSTPVPAPWSKRRGSVR